MIPLYEQFLRAVTTWVKFGPQRVQASPNPGSPSTALQDKAGGLCCARVPQLLFLSAALWGPESRPSLPAWGPVCSSRMLTLTVGPSVQPPSHPGEAIGTVIRDSG
jgi:hypothetical protein